MELAFAYQSRYRKDVFLDLIVYRRKGHNEMDSPDVTSPQMYSAISKQAGVLSLYQSQLIESNILSRETITKARSELNERLNRSVAALDEFVVPETVRERGWDRMSWPATGEWESESIDTGVNIELLQEIGRRSVYAPPAFQIHPRLIKMHIAKRLISIDSGKGIEFSTAEALAIGSLIVEGKSVRLSGQDSGRGQSSPEFTLIYDYILTCFWHLRRLFRNFFATSRYSR
jgi:probable 2-oxoglutarate dehydrogenase E1 component DHKTD1